MGMRHQSLPVNRIRERCALWVLRIAGSAVVALYVVLAAVLPTRPVTDNTPGFMTPVLGFELASEPAHVFGILGAPGAATRDETVRRMDLGNRIDFLFMVAYPALFVGIGLLLAAQGHVRGWVRLVLLVLPVVMTVGDALENRELLVLSAATEPSLMVEPLLRLRLFTVIKWAAIYGWSGLVAVHVWRAAGWWRWSALPFAMAAALGVVSLIHLPAIEYGMFPLAVAWLMAYIRSFQT